MRPLVTVTELAEHFRVHQRTIRRWAKSPPPGFPFPAPILAGRGMRWRGEDIERLEQPKPQAAGASQ